MTRRSHDDPEHDARCGCSAESCPARRSSAHAPTLVTVIPKCGLDYARLSHAAGKTSFGAPHLDRGRP